MDPVTTVVGLGLVSLIGALVHYGLSNHAAPTVDLAREGYERFAKVWVKDDGSVRIQVKALPNEEQPHIEVELSLSDGRPLPLTMHLVDAFQRMQPVERVFLGAKEMDDEMHLEGDADALLIAFDAPTRTRALTLARTSDCSLTIKNGTIYATGPIAGAVAHLRELEIFAKRVLLPAGKEALVARFATEPDGDARDVLAAAILTRNPALLPEIAAAAREDTHQGVRSVIAIAEKNATELARALTWRGMTPRRALAIVKVLTELQNPEAAPGLRAALLNPLLKNARVEIIDALIACNDAACETEILAAFDNGDSATRHATVRWFTQYGSARCVARLRRLENTMLASLTLKAEVRVALEEVRERVGPLGGGEVSLDQGEDVGAVSVEDKDER